MGCGQMAQTCAARRYKRETQIASRRRKKEEKTQGRKGKRGEEREVCWLAGCCVVIRYVSKSKSKTKTAVELSKPQEYD